MTKHEKSRILIFSGVALAAMVLLSAGLSGVKLLPGQPFSIETETLSERGEMMPALGSVEFLSLLIRLLLGLSILSSPFLIIYFIVSPEFRKRVLGSLIPLLWIYMLYIVFTYMRPNFLDGVMPSEMSLPQDSPPVPAADFVANSPSWFTLVVAFCLAVLFTGLLVGIGWYIWRQRRRPPEQDSLEQLAQGAQDALESLQAGDDMKNVVLRCYFEMAQVVSDRRDIERQSDVTPREFEHRLEKAGLPGEHVRPLTRLFEAVRYGAKTLDEDEERQAIACLTAIVAACGEAA